jgi:hypothetical protein
VRRAAITPALWLAFGGAALPTGPSAQALVECRVSYEEAVGALAGLRVTETYDKSVAPDINIRRHYDYPAGLTVFGFPARSFAATEIRKDGIEHLSIMAIIDAPFETVVAASLKSHGLTQCGARETINNRLACAIPVGGTRIRPKNLMIREGEGKTGVGCSYSRRVS